MDDLINETDGFIEYSSKTDDLTQMQPIVQKRFYIFKNSKNKYRVVTRIENNNIQIKKVVDFHIIQLIFEINKEFFEKYILIYTHRETMHTCVLCFATSLRK